MYATDPTRMQTVLLLLGALFLPSVATGCSKTTTSDEEVRELSERLSEINAAAALEKVRARIQRDDQGGIVSVCLWNTKVTDAGLEHLRGLTKLRTLYLSEIQVTDVGLQHLESLTGLCSLFLSSTMITDAGLEHLEGLTEMTLLDLSNTRITDEGLAELKKRLPNCEISL